MDQYIGKLLDNRYEILERIGTGGMAVVYKGRDHRLNRLVAIKILKEELAQDAEFRRRFHDESQAVAMLSHPNIMAVYDVSHTPELDYIVMELLDGITLKQYMQKKGGKLAWREALHFITQIMKALSHAHSRGIIHRDIKPHNIMVLRDGSLKVADFGIARLTSAAQATLTQEALGSVHYISPEQARGSRIDARSDIYSAGVVLYEMITGRLPYEGDSPVAVAIQHINSIPLSPREIDPEIPEALEAITMKAMASDVNQRYISADAMLSDLEEFRKNPSINFDYTPADLLVTDGDEPTQIIGANTPHTVRSQPAHVHHTTEKDDVEYTRPVSKGRKSSRISDPEDYDDYRESDNSRLPIALAIGAIVVFLIGIGAFLWFSFFSGAGSSQKTYSVPSLLGKTMEEAQLIVEEQEGDFQIVQNETVVSNLPAGQIVEQTPDANRRVEAGTIINVNISGGQEDDTDDGEKMPDLLNQDQRIAVKQLRDLGYSEDLGNLILEEQSSDEYTKGYVMQQDPVAETSLDDVDTITLTISTGPEEEKVTVISFLGMAEADARKNAEKQGLVVESVEAVFSDEFEAGRICWQSIDNTTTVPKGTSIRFQVSKGPDPGQDDPETSPSQEPGTTPTPPAETPDSGNVTPVYQNVKVELPNDGRETVQVKILVGGEVQYDRPVDTILQVSMIPVYGNGVQEVQIYIDGVLTSTQTVDFGS